MYFFYIKKLSRHIIYFTPVSARFGSINYRMIYRKPTRLYPTPHRTSGKSLFRTAPPSKIPERWLLLWKLISLHKNYAKRLTRNICIIKRGRRLFNLPLPDVVYYFTVNYNLRFLVCTRYTLVRRIKRFEIFTHSDWTQSALLSCLFTDAWAVSRHCAALHNHSISLFTSDDELDCQWIHVRSRSNLQRRLALYLFL